MMWRLFPGAVRKAALPVLVLAGCAPILAQVAPSATWDRARFFLGAGGSAWHDDFGAAGWDGSGIMEGPTAWFDYFPNSGPDHFHGLGLEIEGREIVYKLQPYAPVYQPSNIREDTIGGGAIYRWHHFHRFVPYGKFLYGIASIDFDVGVPNYHHDTRTYMEGGAGLEMRLTKHLWVRAGYEEQLWQRLFGGADAINLRPRGATLGFEWSFNRLPFLRQR